MLSRNLEKMILNSSQALVGSRKNAAIPIASLLIGCEVFIFTI
jgi:hypothetical protein